MDIFRPALFNFVLSVFVYITSFPGIVKVAVISLKKTKPDNSTAIMSLTGRGVLIQYLIFFFSHECVYGKYCHTDYILR